MTLVKRAAVLLAALHVPASAVAGLATTGCSCPECCSCEYSCRGSGYSSTGEGVMESDGDCLDCDEACASVARQGGCGADDVTKAEPCD